MIGPTGLFLSWSYFNLSSAYHRSSPTLEEEECKDMLYMAAAVVLSLLEQSEAELVEWWLPAAGFLALFSAKTTERCKVKSKWRILLKNAG